MSFIPSGMIKSPTRTLLWVLLVQVLIHLPYLSRPAMGNHVWRQCNTLAVARNYAEEDMRIWLPRIDKRYHFSGVTGPSFTAYEYGLAVIYKVFGFSETAHRWYSLVISLFALAGLFFLTRILTGSASTALFSALALLAIPEFYYHSINAVPDILALATMLWGWYLFVKWWKDRGNIPWLLAVFLLATAGMVKLQFLICGVPIAMMILFYPRQTPVVWMKIVFTVIVVLSASIAWYQYAHFLTFSNWLNEFVHDVRLPDNPAVFFKVLFKNLSSDWVETWLGYPLIPAFFIGLWILYSDKRKAVFWASVGTALAVFVIYVLLQKQFVHHGYYSLFMAPFFAVVTAIGFNKITQSSPYNWAIIFLLVSPVWAWVRISHNWNPENAQFPYTLYSQQHRIHQLTDSSKRYIVGPDQSGCVYFYYLHAKGFPWYNTEEKQDVLSKWVRLGATGIITNQPKVLIRHYSDSLEYQFVDSAAGFYWYDISLKKQ